MLKKLWQSLFVDEVMDFRLTEEELASDLSYGR